MRRTGIKLIQQQLRFWREKKNNMDLTSYGAISKNFKIIARMKNFFTLIKNGKVEQHRLDCYSVNDINNSVLSAIFDKFDSCRIPQPKNTEIFYPSENYPDHVDEGGMSYFIALEEGRFTIENVSYPIVPYVLYEFQDSKPHNTNFGAIMLK